MERGGKFSIARFPTNSLTTTHFRWLHEEAWEESHQRFFLAEMERRSALRLMHATPYEKGKRRPAPERCARYVLELPHGQAVATLEVQGVRRTFNRLSLLVSEIKHPEGWVGSARSALAVGVAAALIMGSADVATVLPTTLEAQEQLLSIGWETVKRVWTPLREDAWLAALKRGGGQMRGMSWNVLELDPAVWWLTPDGMEARKLLAYLEKAVAFRNRPLVCRTPRRGVFAMMQRLLRWH